MNRYEKTFSALKNDGKIGFIPFWMMGDPDPEKSEEIIEILAKNSDVLELGIPFSDPLADGPTIQAAVNRSLEAGMTTDKCFSIIKNIRNKFPQKPIGLLVYFNLILSYSGGTNFEKNIKAFFARASSVGVDSVLIPEIGVEEIAIVESIAKAQKIDLIFLISTNTPEDRVQKIIEKSGGFIYAISTPSVTGIKTDINPKTLDMIQRLKQLTDRPICVGFGISSLAHIELLKKNKADGVIIGSKLFEYREDLSVLEDFCRSCRDSC